MHVGFSTATYSGAEEDGVSEVCITRGGDNQKQFTVRLSATGVTATGKDIKPIIMVLIVLSHPSEGDDYSSVQLPSVITASDFNETKDSVCYKITLRTDDTLEGDETIQLELSTTESFIDFTQPTATFTILESVSNFPVHLCKLSTA